MKLRITKPRGFAWYSYHVGKEYNVLRITAYLDNDGGIQYDVNKSREPGRTSFGVVRAEDCEITDWTGWPFMEAKE